MQQIRSQIAEEMNHSRLSQSKLNGYQSPQLRTSMIDQQMLKSQAQEQKQKEIENELQQSRANQQQIEADHQILAESLNDQQQQLEIQKSNFNDFTDHINHFMQKYSQNLIDIANAVKDQQEELKFLKQQNETLTQIIQKQQEQIAALAQHMQQDNMCECEANGCCCNHCCCCGCENDEECSEEEYDEEERNSEGEIKA